MVINLLLGDSCKTEQVIDRQNLQSTLQTKLLKLALNQLVLFYIYSYIILCILLYLICQLLKQQCVETSLQFLHSKSFQIHSSCLE